jgi:hypothetical protein
MAQYRYGGKEPVPDGAGGILRPLDLAEFAEPPGEPWEPVDAPAEPEPEPDAKPAAPAGKEGK